MAVTAIILAGILDGLDGTVARLLKSTSKFGAELDSLSDVVAFGVAPAVILYLWGLQSLDRIGWAVSLIYAIAMALRLARFNARMEDEDEPRRRLGFLTGVPAPMGAGLLLAPLMLEFILGKGQISNFGLIVSGYAIFIAILMVSTFPTISMKAFRVKKDLFVPFMLVIGAILAGLFAKPWIVLLSIGALYLVSIPLSLVSYKKRKQQVDARR
ncbi:hypothetical protein GCM10017044_22780 [Kordiimonas sediminis]|uniref:CDP-alcohol phosphatidyltransferase C-terminal domain-containing protein n=2 Tax=Kordiimonas sediminis TaxID=1735581 RepID=A0A919AWQ5_9PROT|nr:hypothetical protein GCM10017044_22780 [Kordiimonas sediminis]